MAWGFLGETLAYSYGFKAPHYNFRRNFLKSLGLGLHPCQLSDCVGGKGCISSFQEAS
jgi:hypothetical protein